MHDEMGIGYRKIANKLNSWAIRSETGIKVWHGNNVYGIFRAVQGGVGIAALPDYLASEDPNLLRILPDLDGPAVPAFFVYPEELRKSKRISVLRDFLIQEVAKTSF